jgi:TonB family protein
MSFLTRWLNRLRRGAWERDFDDEVRAHLDLRVSDNLRAGMTQEEAEADAFRRFGSVEEAKGGMRRARGLPQPSRRPAFVVLAAAAAAIVVTILVQRGPSYYRVGEDNVESPQVVSNPRPQYTAEAMQAQLQGRVALECVVQTDGVCTDLRVVESLDPAGLDEQAAAALRQWRFEPGRRNGDPVPVLVNVEFMFTLR